VVCELFIKFPYVVFQLALFNVQRSDLIPAGSDCRFFMNEGEKEGREGLNQRFVLISAFEADRYFGGETVETECSKSS
jgi:hypothetical protein